MHQADKPPLRIFDASNILDSAVAIQFRLSVRPSVCHISDPRLNNSRYRDMIYTTMCRCLRIVVEQCMTLWYSSLNSVMGRYGTEK